MELKQSTIIAIKYLKQVIQAILSIHLAKKKKLYKNS